jgi:prophage regulatory protein
MTDMELLTAKDVCELLKVNASTLWRWVKAGNFPAPMAIGPNCTRWQRREVAGWLNQVLRDKPRDNNSPALGGDGMKHDAT